MSNPPRSTAPRPEPTHTRLILVRHGETEGNVSQVWHGAMDAPLTPRGLQQVEATAVRVLDLHRQWPIDAFYVSPLPRAQSTAAAIAAATGVHPAIEEGLREFSLGDWEGRSFRDLRESEDLWGRWQVDPTFAPPNAESPHSFNRRVVATLRGLVGRHIGGTLLTVSHGGVIGSALASFIGDHPDDWRRFDPHNCAISVLVWDGIGWAAELVNCIDHLPAAARANNVPDY